MSFWDNLWDIVWWVFSATVFFAYLFTLFAVIGDLFRDQSLNGWAKAIWIIFMVFLPFLTVLVYIIARGKGMNERAMERSRAARESTEEYIRRVAASPSEEISKAQDLLNAGSINQEEFQAIKNRALAAA
ncbi:ABC-type Fe3+ transport system permease subunit [Arthrobacter sp. UYP6]|uniref:PLDc N-terminal domain-containing protein n=1 Tax=Arthrobacter sp. UYP6 TaxID=1756378 RepID=UPI00339A5F3D